MALFISMTETRLKRVLMVFFVLASLFPVIISLLTVYQYVIPVLKNGQVEVLRDVFNNALLAILLIQLMSFILFWGWIKSWETVKKRIQLISSNILKGREVSELGENELLALQKLFQEIQDEFQNVAGRLQEYFRRSISDELTSLYNRTYFRYKITDEFRRSRSSGHDLSLVLFSVDDFSRYSEEVGDHLLKEMGRLLRRYIRKTDLPFRCGRHRFALLLPGCPGALAGSLCRKLAGAVDGHGFTDGHGLPLGKVSICCGIASGQESSEELMRVAEEALALAKGLGRGNVQVYDPCPGTGSSGTTPC